MKHALCAFALFLILAGEAPARAAAASDATLAEAYRAWINAALEIVSKSIEVAGVGAIVISAAVSTLVFLRAGGASGWGVAFRAYRANLGRGILLGLELLVAADIVGTVAITPTFQNLGVLALIVLIRTFLSFSLEVEIEGHWPWQKGVPPAGE